MSQGNWPYEVSRHIKRLLASNASATHKTLAAAAQVCCNHQPAHGGILYLQAMVDKTNNIITKTIKGAGVLAAQAMVAMCPTSLQTEKMLKATEMKRIVPLIDEKEWDKYIVLPAQKPPPSSTAGCVEWWKSGFC